MTKKIADYLLGVLIILFVVPLLIVALITVWSIFFNMLGISF